LYSGSNKSFKVWDLEQNKQVSELKIDEIKINAAGSVVKSLVVWPNRHYIFTAVQGNVLVWDLVDLTHKG
jgi:WD40 repeat protein